MSDRELTLGEDRAPRVPPSGTPLQQADEPRPVEGRQRDLVIWVDRRILQLTRHWLLLFNLAVGLYVGIPFLAPTLMHLGHEGAGRLLQRRSHEAPRQGPPQERP